MEKEYSWLTISGLSDENITRDSSENETLISFLWLPTHVFKASAFASMDIATGNFGRSDSISSDDPDVSAAEVLRYSECCGQCMRTILNLVKPKRESAITSSKVNSPGIHESWKALIQDLLTTGIDILGSGL